MTGEVDEGYEGAGVSERRKPAGLGDLRLPTTNGTPPDAAAEAGREGGGLGSAIMVVSAPALRKLPCSAGAHSSGSSAGHSSASLVFSSVQYFIS